MAHAHPLLPDLKEDAQIAIEKPGTWQLGSSVDVEKLRKGLNVTPVRIRVNSIPDIWARPLLFEMALFDESHVLHEQVRGEWRGLLALLALKAVKNLDKLQLLPISLSKSENPGSNTAFTDAAHRLLPTSTISPDTSWSNSYLIIYHDGRSRPIGMTSPTTLVFTSSYYFNYISNISWFDAESLVDPVDHLSAIERPALSSWLAKLQHELRSLLGDGDVNDVLLNKLLGLLGSFIEDVGQTAAAQDFRQAQSGFGISPAHGIYHFLEFPSDPGPASTDSPVKLVPSEGRSGQPPIMIVDRNIADQWGLEARNIPIGNRTLADLSPAGHPLGEHDRFAGSKVENAEVWNSVEFFSNKLVALRVPNAFPGARELKWDGQAPNDLSFVLPLKEKLLEYLSPEDLLRRSSLEVLPNGGFKVRLRLPLGGPASTQEYVAQKDYTGDDIEYVENPIVEMFPNFQVPGWKSYFLSYYTENAEFSFQVRPYTASDPQSRFEAQVDSSGGEHTLWRLSEYPESLVCKFENVDAGLLFPSPPRIPANRPGMFKIGVDFGASGTSVYLKAPDADPAPFVASSHKLNITNQTDIQRSRALDRLLPDEAVTIPFLSLYRQLRHESGLLRLQALTEGHIHYYTADADSNLRRSDIYANLKWSSEPDSRVRVNALLLQVCLQAAAEVASLGGNSIEWSFSYPTAFSDDEQHEFTTAWQRIVEECENLTGWKFMPPRSLTESVASGLYFRSVPQAPTAIGAVFIDIGSSTSDISLWQGDELLWQASLRLAGRDVFLKYVEDHLEVLEGFNLPVEKLRQTRSGEDETKIWAETDALLQKSSDEIFRNLPMRSETPEVKRLKQHLALGISGLMYYIGMSIGRLMSDGLFSQPLPPVYFGGNGSRMLRWLSNGSKDVSTSATKLLERIYRAGIGRPIDGNFRIALSEDPKQEAAYGLVCDLLLNQGTDTPHSRQLLAGEEFVTDAGVQPPTVFVDRAVFKSGIKTSRRLPTLHSFVGEFNKFIQENRSFADEVEWDTRVEEALVGKVATRISDLRSTGMVDAEPIFVIALRALLDLRNSG